MTVIGRRSMVAALAALALVTAGCASTNVATDVSDAAETSTTSTTQAPAAADTTAPDAGGDGPNDVVTMVGVDGVEAEIADTSRLIPTNGSIAEIVWELGLGDSIVATDASATHPAELDASPKIGYQRTLAAESLLSFEPTAIIGTEDTGPPEVIDQVRDAGVPVLILPSYNEVDDAPTRILEVAEALGVTEEGEALADRVRSEIEDARSLLDGVETSPRVAFVYARGPNTVLLSGQGTVAQSLIESAGGIDVGSESGVEGFVPLTPEAMVAADPDVLIVLDAGLESLGGIDGLLEVPGVALSTAGQNRAVLTFDDLAFNGLTPRVGEVLRSLIEGLHGLDG
ncbi:MAG: ABC transporter substrate-binding protein [Acidimicrobiia bacterium]